MDMRTARAIQRKKMKDMPFPRKLEYIWEYGKPGIGAVLLVLLIVASVLYYRFYHRENALYVSMVNAVGTESPVFDEFLEASGFGTQRYAVDVTAELKVDPENPSVQDAKTMEVLYTLFGTGNLDLYAADEEMFLFFAETGALEDLRKLFPESYLQENADRLILATVQSSGEQIVAGILPAESSRFMAAGYYDTPVPLGIAAGAIHSATALACIIWLTAPM